MATFLPRIVNAPSRLRNVSLKYAYLAVLTLLGVASAQAQTAANKAATIVQPPAKENFHIYLLMGQSNMAGRGEIAPREDNSHVLTLNASNQWVVARDPLFPQVGRTVPGVGPGIPFALEMAKADANVTIGLVPCAVGGTALSHWVKGGDLYEKALAQAKLAAQVGVISGVLWHQGESDTTEQKNADTYDARLSQMFKDLRQDLGKPDLPIVVGQLGPFLQTAKYPYVDTVRTAIKHVATEVPHVGFADSNELTDRGDQLHFNTASQNIFGVRYAQAMLALQKPPSTPQVAQLDSVRIAHFSGDRAAAISYTFDDGIRDQYTLALPMLNEVGFKGTFFEIAGKVAETPEEGEQRKDSTNVRAFWGGISWPELKKMSDQGHEIASHTWSHTGLTKLSPAELDAEYKKSYDAIFQHIGKAPLTIAFPGNSSNPAVQAAALKYYVAYRAFQQSTSDKSTVASLNAWADKLVQDRKWGIMMTHGIAQGYAAMTDPEIFHTHLKYVKSREKDIWVDTFANVARYEKERDDAKVTVVEAKPGSLTLTLTGTLDPKIYDVPLTIIVEAKDAMKAQAACAGKALDVSVDKGAIYIQATPATQPIIITWQ